MSGDRRFGRREGPRFCPVGGPAFRIRQVFVPHLSAQGRERGKISVKSPCNRHCGTPRCSRQATAATLLLTGLLSLQSTTVTTAQEAATQPAVDFTREVKPILAKRCFSCHGPDVGEGGLRLHEKDAAFAELDSGDHAV